MPVVGDVAESSGVTCTRKTATEEILFTRVRATNLCLVGRVITPANTMSKKAIAIAGTWRAEGCVGFARRRGFVAICTRDAIGIFDACLIACGIHAGIVAAGFGFLEALTVTIARMAHGCAVLAGRHTA